MSGDTSATPRVDSFRQRATAGAMWSSVEMLAVQGLSLVVFSILAHFLVPRDFGLLAINFTLIYSLKSLLVDQITLPVTRKQKATEAEWATAFWICCALGIAGAALLIGISFICSEMLHQQELGRIMRPMSLMLVVLSINRTQEVWLMRHFAFRVLALRSIAGVALGAVLGIWAAIHGYGVWSLVMQQVVGSLAGLGLLLVTTPWRPRLLFSGTMAWEMAKFVRGIGGNALLGVLNQNADTWLIAGFFGTAAAGIYSVGKRLTSALQMVAANPVTNVTLPVLAETQNDHARQQRLFLSATTLVFTACAPVFLGAAGIARPTIIFVFGAQWVGAASIFAWLSVGALCAVSLMYFNNVLILRNRPSWLSMLAGLQAVLSIVLFLILRHKGQDWIAAPFVLPYLVTLPVSAILALRLLNIKLWQWMKAAALPILAAIFMAACVHMLSNEIQTLKVLPRLVVLALAGTLIYAALVCLFLQDMLRTSVLPVLRRRLTAK